MLRRRNGEWGKAVANWLTVSACALAVAGCATNIAPQNHTILPSKVRLASFENYVVRPLAVEKMEGDSGDQAAITRMDTEIRACLANVFRGLKEGPISDAAKGKALLIEPIIVDLKKVNVAERFWVGPLAGSSAVLLKLKLSDDGVKEIVAEPTFYAKANAWGGAFTFAATDNAMLSRIVSDACNYARQNL
jgi:hypothetical protein